jgi:hypothetical protein
MINMGVVAMFRMFKPGIKQAEFVFATMSIGCQAAALHYLNQSSQSNRSNSNTQDSSANNETCDNQSKRPRRS